MDMWSLTIVPILQFGSGNNFNVFKEKLALVDQVELLVFLDGDYGSELHPSWGSRPKARRKGKKIEGTNKVRRIGIIFKRTLYMT